MENKLVSLHCTSSDLPFFIAREKMFPLHVTPWSRISHQHGDVLVFHFTPCQSNFHSFRLFSYSDESAFSPFSLTLVLFAGLSIVLLYLFCLISLLFKTLSLLSPTVLIFLQPILLFRPTLSD